MEVIAVILMIVAFGYFLLKSSRSVSMERAIKENLAQRDKMREALNTQRRITKTKEQDYEEAKKILNNILNDADKHTK